MYIRSQILQADLASNCFPPTCCLSTAEQHWTSSMLNYQGNQNFSKRCLSLYWLFLLRSNSLSLEGCDSHCSAALSWSSYVTWKFPTSVALDFTGQLRLILSDDLPECWRKLAVGKASTKKADLLMLDIITTSQEVLQDHQYPLKYWMFSSHVLFTFTFSKFLYIIRYCDKLML